MKTREMAPPGFHQTLVAHQATAPAQRVVPGIAEAVKRQTKAMRELSQSPRGTPPHMSRSGELASCDGARSVTVISRGGC